MLQESTNPEMFTQSGGKRLTADAVMGNKKVLTIIGGIVVALLVVVAMVWALSGDDDGAQSPAAPAAQSPESASASEGPSTPVLDPATEVPGVMIPYQPDLADGMKTPSQTIQTMARNFYGMRSTAAVMPYIAPGSSMTESFIDRNIKGLQVGTKLTGFYMVRADADKLKNKNPVGADPQAWLVTAIFELASGKTYVDSLFFMTVRVGSDYKIQEFSTLTN